MPTIHKMFNLEVTVSQFLRACSNVELQELGLLLDSELRRREAGEQRTKMIEEFRSRGTESKL